MGSRVPGSHGVMRKLREEFLNRCFRIETDFVRVRADERAAEDPARQPGDVVALERLEHRHGDLGAGRDLAERHALALARAAEFSAEIPGPL